MSSLLAVAAVRRTTSIGDRDRGGGVADFEVSDIKDGDGDVDRRSDEVVDEGAGDGIVNGTVRWRYRDGVVANDEGGYIEHGDGDVDRMSFTEVLTMERPTAMVVASRSVMFVATSIMVIVVSVFVVNCGEYWSRQLMFVDTNGGSIDGDDGGCDVNGGRDVSVDDGEVRGGDDFGDVAEIVRDGFYNVGDGGGYVEDYGSSLNSGDSDAGVHGESDG